MDNTSKFCYFRHPEYGILLDSGNDSLAPQEQYILRQPIPTRAIYPNIIGNIAKHSLFLAANTIEEILYRDLSYLENSSPIFFSKNTPKEIALGAEQEFWAPPLIVSLPPLDRGDEAIHSWFGLYHWAKIFSETNDLGAILLEILLSEYLSVGQLVDTLSCLPTGVVDLIDYVAIDTHTIGHIFIRDKEIEELFIPKVNKLFEYAKRDLLSCEILEVDPLTLEITSRGLLEELILAAEL